MNSKCLCAKHFRYQVKSQGVRKWFEHVARMKNERTAKQEKPLEKTAKVDL